MKNIIILIAFTLTVVTNAQNKLPFQLEKDWEISGFKNPESVVLDAKNNVLYVSNINGAPTDKDGNGFISKVSLEGKIIDKEWVSGLNAPKGLAIRKGKLYVTDINDFVVIDIKTKSKKVFAAEGSTFLNDITVDKKGNAYASNTFGFSAIYKLSKKGNVELWLKDEALKMPNGLYVSKRKLFVAGWGQNMNPETYETKENGPLLSVDLKSKKIEAISKPAGNLDGLSQTLHGFLVSDWLAGKLLYYSDETKTVTEALDLPQGSADTYFDKETKSVFIPLMLDNKLLKYHFEKPNLTGSIDLGKQVNEVQLIDFERLPHDTISSGITRQWFHGAKGQMAYFHMKKGAHIPMHSHPNEQITYIMEGKVKVITYYKGEKKEYIIEKGQVITFPENVPHEFFALENTLDLDVHVPVRQDWLTNELPDYLKASK